MESSSKCVKVKPAYQAPRDWYRRLSWQVISSLRCSCLSCWLLYLDRWGRGSARLQKVVISTIIKTQSRDVQNLVLCFRWRGHSHSRWFLPAILRMMWEKWTPRLWSDTLTNCYVSDPQIVLERFSVNTRTQAIPYKACVKQPPDKTLNRHVTNLVVVVTADDQEEHSHEEGGVADEVHGEALDELDQLGPS